ncbi:hypothetical protein Tco_0486495 [Tanacetum coccineum]
MLDQTFDRLQKLVSQLKLLGEIISQEDVNYKLLRSLSPEWNTHVVVWRNKTDLDTMSMNDLYNNLKVYEPEVKGMSSSSSSTQNMAFMSSSNNNNSNTNGVVSTAQAINTANGFSAANTQVNASNIDNLSDAVIFPPPYTRNFMPPTHDLSFTGLDEFVNKPVVENKNFDEEVSKVVRKCDDAPIIKDWVSDSEEENVSQTKTEKKTLSQLINRTQSKPVKDIQGVRGMKFPV